MEILGLGLILIGALISFCYSIALIIAAFETSLLWGICYLFLPLVPLLFLIVHWDVAGRLFVRSLAAIPFILGGMYCLSLVAQT